jgi:hypothetical protein
VKLPLDAAQTEEAPVSTQELEPRLVTGTRNGRYGEVLLVYPEEPIRLEVYNSYVLNECPQELWSQLSPETIAAETGALFAVLNGPRYWLMDGIGKINNVTPSLRNFGGIEMRLAATILVDGIPDRAPYRHVTVNRGAIWFFDAGKEVHELVAPDGRTYVMQAYCTGVDPTLTEDALAGLGDRLALPEGWRYRTRVLSEELRVDTTGAPATVLQDELENTYTLLS